MTNKQNEAREKAVEFLERVGLHGEDVKFAFYAGWDAALNAGQPEAVDITRRYLDIWLTQAESNAFMGGDFDRGWKAAVQALREYFAQLHAEGIAARPQAVDAAKVEGLRVAEGQLHCGDNCGHTAIEHLAFDDGYYDRDVDYDLPHLREIYLIGKSVGDLCKVEGDVCKHCGIAWYSHDSEGCKWQTSP